MRIALGIEYQGSDFHGWQSQLSGIATIQQAVERALSKVANEPIIVHCAGRTDAGVHATGQVVHFDTNAVRQQQSWVLGANANLPKSISVRWAQPVVDEFHARYSAVARRYHYYLYNNPVRGANMRYFATWFCQPLELTAMQSAAEYLLGEHDFTSFRGSACQAKTPHRHLQHLQITRRNDLFLFDIKANAFLHHMVRNIVGTLLQVGQQLQPPTWVESVLQAKDRSAAGITAPPFGLFLTKVYYPENFAIPDPGIAPFL